MSSEAKSTSPGAGDQLPKGEKICTQLWTRAIRGTPGKKDQNIGLEVEMFAYDAKTFAPLGLPEARLHSRDLIARLEKLIPHSGIKVDRETDVIVGLELPNGGNFSLEPGGQVEFSSHPCSSHAEVIRETAEAFRALEYAAQGEVVFLDHGTNPAAPTDLPLLVPKKRYQILDRYFTSESRGRGVHMMRHTATIQPNIDISGDEDWSDAANLAFALTPFVRHLFSNSKYFQGRRSRFTSERQAIWERTDSSRTGIPESVVFAENVPCAYSNWARNANVFLVGDLPIHEQPRFGELRFVDWLNSGFKGHFPTLQDWETHLGTLFPDLRLRGFLEVRSVDAQSFEHAVAPMVFWSTVLRSRTGRERLWDFLFALSIGHFGENASRESDVLHGVVKSLLSLPSDAALFKDVRVHQKLLEVARECLDKENDAEGYAALEAYGRYILERENRQWPHSGLDFVKETATLHPEKLFLSNLGLSAKQILSK